MKSKAEHPDKARNIVIPHAEEFFKYYQEALIELEDKNVFVFLDSDTISVSPTNDVYQFLIQNLP